MLKAQLVGCVAGKPVYRFPLEVRLNDSHRCETVKTIRTDVLSHTAADAANWARDIAGQRPETEIIVTGPRGGETRRYVGWFSAIGNALLETRPAQLDLFGAS